MWTMLRYHALLRHRLVWLACGANPDTWKLHKDMIKSVYGW